MNQEELRSLLKSMTLQEKINQMLQLNGSFYQEEREEILTGPARKVGVQEENIEMAGSILGAYGAEKLIDIQKRYMEKQPHHIPMLFMMDVIHGMRTIFPIPLAQGATFEPEMSEKCAAVAAKEASVSGLHVTFSPMTDLVRDARWGRVMESTGEDPYLNGKFAAAQVRGFQGDNMDNPYKICACIKHFAAYGCPQAGREYNTVELSEHTLRDFYLPAYKEGMDAGAGMVMTSFNTLNGIPASTNKWLMRDVLREEMKFDGVVISDFAAILETIAHGQCKDAKEAAKRAIEAGVDIDMMTNVYAVNLRELVETGEIDEKLIDESTMRILELKNKLGLFENPYKDADFEKEKKILLCKEHRNLAREVAGKSFVLLKNEGLLPIDMRKRIAFIGPYINNKEIISSWAVTGRAEDSVTIEEAAREVFDSSRTSYLAGCTVLNSRYDSTGITASVQETLNEQNELFREAIEAARTADIVIMPLGEHFLQSGEAASRAMIEVPEIQMHLFREVAKVNENIVVVLFNGRPLDLREISKTAKSILEVWMPGTEGGHAIVDVLVGKVNPSGKLPMSFPYCVGQIPIYYNEYSTGRPNLKGVKERYHSRYIDIPNEPLYPFGYGLSYTSFQISPIQLSNTVIKDDESLLASVTVKNTGNVAGAQVVQLYIQDIAASVVRPVKELKGFEKLYLKPGEEKTCIFTVDETMLRFLREDETLGSEEGEFHIWIGESSITDNMAQFVYKKVNSFHYNTKC